MSKSDYLEQAFLELILNATPIANIADNAATAPLTQIYVSLHTGDPGEAGDQSTSETTYTGYARIGVARTAGGWSVTAGVASPVSDILFGTVTAGTGTITHVGIGTDVSGAGNLLWYGALTPQISIVNGAEPKVTAGSTITED